MKTLIVCGACGNKDLEYLTQDVELWDHLDNPWIFSAYRCTCGEITVATYTSQESIDALHEDEEEDEDA